MRTTNIHADAPTIAEATARAARIDDVGIAMLRRGSTERPRVAGEFLKGHGQRFAAFARDNPDLVERTFRPSGFLYALTPLGDAVARLGTDGTP